MEIVEYKNLEWYVINENDKEKLLLLRDSLNAKLIDKFFRDKTMIKWSGDGVSFSKYRRSPWWSGSYIRYALNERNNGFLSYLDARDLSVMKTATSMSFWECWSKRGIDTTLDYVRLLTKEEIGMLTKEVLATEGRLGYWTMSPYCYLNGCCDASVFYMPSYGDKLEDLKVAEVGKALAIRPVICKRK